MNKFLRSMGRNQMLPHVVKANAAKVQKRGQLIAIS